MTAPAPPRRIEISSYSWPEVSAGTDLAALVVAAVAVADGDVVVITSKVVSKAEDRVETGARPRAVERELTRVVARRGPNVIAETRHGLVMAAAGVDASNVSAGSVVTLPSDPDSSARRLRERLYELTGCNVAVVVTDTAGRAWRNGQADMAIGCAGMLPLVDLAGTTDPFGNVLSVTAPAIADEIAAAAELVKGKASGRPLAIVRGLTDQVLPRSSSGPGAQALVRHRDDDLFGLGARDAAAAAALRADRVALAHFPRRIRSDPEPFDGVVSAASRVRLTCTGGSPGPGDPSSASWLVEIHVRHPVGSEEWMEVGALAERVRTLAAANRLRAEALPVAEGDTGSEGWRTVTRTVWSVA